MRHRLQATRAVVHEKQTPQTERIASSTIWGELYGSTWLRHDEQIYLELLCSCRLHVSTTEARVSKKEQIVQVTLVDQFNIHRTIKSSNKTTPNVEYTWVRLDHAFPSNPEVLALKTASRYLLVNLFIMASKKRNLTITARYKTLELLVGCSKKAITQALQELKSAGLIDVNLEDGSALRAGGHYEATDVRTNVRTSATLLPTLQTSPLNAATNGSLLCEIKNKQSQVKTDVYQNVTNNRVERSSKNLNQIGEIVENIFSKSKGKKMKVFEQLDEDDLPF